MINKRFNIKHIGLMATSLFFLCQPSFSQSEDWMSEYEINALEKMNLIYTKPNKFDEVIGHGSFKNSPIPFWLEYKFNHNQLHSKDNRFIVFINVNDINPIHKKNEIISFNRLSYLSPKEKERFKSGEVYINFMKRGILKYKGEEAAANWEDYVNFYSKEETVNKFNADKAISYSIKLQPKDYYQGEYNNLWVLFLQKKYRRFKTFEEYKTYKEAKKKEVNEFLELKGKTLEEINVFKKTKGYKDFKKSWENSLNELNEFSRSTGFVMMYCFYKDMPKRKLAKYKAKVEGIFRYED